MTLLDKKLDTMPPGSPAKAFGVDEEGVPVLFNGWQVVAAGAGIAAHTGGTSEQTFATVVLPAGSMGPNGIIRITTLWSTNNNANSKTVRVKFGGVTFMQTALTASVTWPDERVISNVGSEASQISKATGGFAFSTSGSLKTVATVDTAADQSIAFTGQLANAADNVALEQYIIEVCYLP